MKAIHSLALAALLVTGFPALAQATPAPQASPQGAPAREPDPDPSLLKAMKSRVFVLQYRDAGQIAGLLRPLGSGIRGTNMSFTSGHDLDAITVRDFPENLAAIEEALKRLDVPAAASQSPDVELHFQVLFASRTPLPHSEVPEELGKVLATLRNALAYRGFTPVASFVQRAKIQRQDRNTLDGSGLVDPKFLSAEETQAKSNLELSWWAKGLTMATSKEGLATYSLDVFRFNVRERGPKGLQVLANFETGLSLKDGESVVVGTSVLKDRGLIVVVSARRVQ